MKKIIKLLSPLFLLLIILSVGGVYATFEYSRAAPTIQENNFQYGIEDFYYAENLPSDEKGELYHGGLLEKIISNTEGINNPNSLLSNAIETRKEDYKNNVSSNQQVSGGNLKNTFSTVEGFEYVGFLLVFDSETQYSIYTFDNRLTQKRGDEIEAYKTYAILKEGVWVLYGGYKGVATVDVYDGKTNGPYKNTIAPASWRQVD